MKKIKKLVWAILNTMSLGGIIQLGLKSALLDDGWFLSFKKKQSVDKNGKPLAWITYPALKFIEPRLKSSFKVFEFGCGNSTIWYSSKVETIKAVDDDEHWVNLISPQLPENASVIYKAINDYHMEISVTAALYDMVIIDGKERNKCTLSSLPYLKKDGVFIYDNTDREEYLPSINHLFSLGFKRIDFWGLSPITSHNTCTSIFYRTNNCLGI